MYWWHRLSILTFKLSNNGKLGSFSFFNLGGRLKASICPYNIKLRYNVKGAKSFFLLWAEVLECVIAFGLFSTGEQEQQELLKFWTTLSPVSIKPIARHFNELDKRRLLDYVLIPTTGDQRALNYKVE
ncbi:hypothetical protein TNCV_3221011 [Trichonephila clavipes]|nr:hypothetical protein TNCV_3221011 [Trichonephila clavipes]